MHMNEYSSEVRNSGQGVRYTIMLGIKVEVHMELDGTRIAVIRYRYA